jgi:hypothetical protein
MIDQLAIVGSLAEYLNGNNKVPGDIDVLIERALCERYWDFLELLTGNGITSVRDVIDWPPFSWKPCSSEIAHALALTIDCAALTPQVVHSPNDKDCSLDICLKADDLDRIPYSQRWVDWLDPRLDGAERGRAIREGHERLVSQLRAGERVVSTPILCQELGLYYRL